jgi:hypothetical protein
MIENDKLLIDLRTIDTNEEDELIEAILSPLQGV